MSFIYYGLTLNVDSLGGNLYANYALLGLVELAGYCVIFFVNMTGRKPAHLVAIFGCGVASIGSILLILFAENSASYFHLYKLNIEDYLYIDKFYEKLIQTYIFIFIILKMYSYMDIAFNVNSMCYRNK